MTASYELFDDLAFESILRNTFLTEAGEVLEEIEPSILSFEKNPKKDQDLLQIFRVLHTFKDSASVAGFLALRDFTHKIENLLSALINRDLDPDATVIEILFQCNDGLRDFVTALTADQKATFDTSAIEARISKVLRREEEIKGKEEIRSTLLPSATEVCAPTKPVRTSDRPKILVVDDEPELRECINLILTAEGYDVVEAENGKIALDMALNDPEIKLLLTDQSMPVMKGEELVQRLRDNHIKIPVIVITGVADHTAAVKFIQSGVYLYLTKPIDGDDLILAVRNALRSGELAETLKKALALTFRNYLRLRRVNSEVANPMTQMKLEFDMTEDLKVMGELITRVLKKE